MCSGAYNANVFQEFLKSLVANKCHNKEIPKMINEVKSVVTNLYLNN